MRSSIGVLTVALFLLLMPLSLGPRAAEAASCTVPSAQYPTIQSGVDDPSCSEVLLGTQTYVESVAVGRSLNLVGVSSASTVVQGQITVTAGVMAVQHLRVDTEPEGLRGRFAEAFLVTGGGRVVGLDVTVVHRALLFGDGFEIGTTAAWSGVAP